MMTGFVAEPQICARPTTTGTRWSLRLLALWEEINR